MTKKQQAALDAAMKAGMQVVIDLVAAEKKSRTAKRWDRLTIATLMRDAARELNRTAKIIGGR